MKEDPYANAKERKALYYVCQLCHQKVHEDDVWAKRNADPKGWDHAECRRVLGREYPTKAKTEIAELQQRRADRDEKRAARMNGWVL